MRGKSLSCTLRLGAKDGDLLLLAKHYGIAELVFFAVQKHLGKHTGSLKLPPPENVEERIYAVRVSESKDADAYRFLSSVPSGNRSQVIKMLIRRATEECDIRFLTGGYAVKKATREYEHGKAPKPPTAQKPYKPPLAQHNPPPPPVQTPVAPVPAAPQERDEIFDFI